MGEYIVGQNPDCEHGSCSPPIQKFGIEKVIIHESWDSGRNGFLKGNDIALVRVDGLIKLFTVSIDLERRKYQLNALFYLKYRF